MGMRVVGHTCARTVVLAVEEGPPSPAARPGPIHGMGRAKRCQAHPSRAQRSATHNAVDENRPASTRTFVGRPAQADEVESAREADHDNMRIMR